MLYLNESVLSGWVEATVKPIRVGWYLVESPLVAVDYPDWYYIQSDGGPPNIGLPQHMVWRYWTGTGWRWLRNGKWSEATVLHRWRGLAETFPFRVA